MRCPDRTEVEQALAAAASQLPPQPPLARFIHFISLQGDLALPFPEAVRRARERRGVHGWPGATFVREAIRSGRIPPDDVAAALVDVLGPDGALSLGSHPPRPVHRHEVLSVALEHSVVPIAPATLRDRLLEGATERVVAGVSSDASRRLLRGRAAPGVLSELWEALRTRTLAVEGAPPDARTTVAGAWSRYVERDLDAEVSALLTPWLARFADVGVAAWRSTTRRAGLWPWLQRWAFPGGWASQLPADPIDAIRLLLGELGVPLDQVASAVEREVMALQGWSAMAAWLDAQPPQEGNGDRALSLAHVVAGRLALTAKVVTEVAPTLQVGPSGTALNEAVAGSAHVFALREAAVRGALSDDLTARVRALHDAATPLAAAAWRRLADAALRQAHAHHADAQAQAGAVTWPLFVLLQHLGLDGDAVRGFGEAGLAELHTTLARFDVDTFGAVALTALERGQREVIGRALAVHRGTLVQPPAATSQVVTCIDDREESLRRHLEALDAGIETFSAAGFFLVPMLYQGVQDARATARCPVVVTPRHLVVERVRAGAVVPKPTRTDRALRLLGLAPPTRVPTRLDHTAPEALEGACASRPQLGFTDSEQVDIVAASLVAWGLHHPAPIVVVLGHGSTSTNNPYELSYGCGACAGHPGGANARLLAAMANRPAVRRLLAERGVQIPSTTWFLGAQHDTASDEVTWYDLDDLPPTHEAAFAALLTTVRAACACNAKERVRRLPLAPVDSTDAEALQHVRRRAIDPRQPRPELGHTGNALAIVGRRALTRGLSLDRRAFLVSYDASVDPDGSVLEATLMASGPVGAQINLDYYFSTTDRERLGGGSKAGQNLVAGVGVLQGAEGDLRTGLPWQMIEQHEPLRLLLFVEATLAHLGQVHARREVIRQLLDGAWVHLVAIDPTSGAMHRFVPGTGFVAWGHDHVA